jgi:peptidoglycan DL-endopeptidase CwlO
VVTPPVTTPPVSSDPYGLGTGVSRGSAAAGEAAVAWAKTQLGLPYGWGATGPGAYDCSGLVMRAWQNAGVSLNRTTMDQYRQVKKISYDSLRVGDLIFWGWDANNPDSVTHVALWLGNGQILEAPRTGLDVRITSMRWSGTMPFAGRP